MNQTPSPNRQGSEYGLGTELLKEIKLKKLGRQVQQEFIRQNKEVAIANQNCKMHERLVQIMNKKSPLNQDYLKPVKSSLKMPSYEAKKQQAKLIDIENARLLQAIIKPKQTHETDPDVHN